MSSNFILMGRGGLLSSIVLNKLVETNLSPKLVIIEDVESDYPNLTEIVCKKHSIDFVLSKNINGHEVINVLKKHNPNMVLVASLGTIINAETLSVADFFNVHMGVLPYFKGAFTNFWKIKSGDDIFGVTIHEMTEKIDSGKIVYIKEKDFSDIIHGYDFIRQNYIMAAEAVFFCFKEKLFKKKEDFFFSEEKGMYYKKHTREDLKIDFSLPCKKLYKMINRLRFYGKPYFIYKEREIEIESAQLLTDYNSEKKLIFKIIDESTMIFYSETGILELKICRQ